VKEFPPFRFDTANQCLWRSHDTGEYERVLLAPKAFGVLQYLVEHTNRLVTHRELIEALWPDTFIQPAVLSSHIRDLRRALGDNPKNPRFIETLAAEDTGSSPKSAKVPGRAPSQSNRQKKSWWEETLRSLNCWIAFTRCCGTSGS
jgi:hypothetical protein